MVNVLVMQDAVSEIKSRLNIEDLVSQYVTLKRTGSSLKGLCPFHAEKSPSFVVSPERGIAYCFGCHKGGDIFKFLQEIEGVDFGEALKILADRTGIELESKKYNNKIIKSNKSDLFEIHEEVTSFYQKKLWDSVEGMKVLEYLKNRGINEETIKTFRLGFAPDSFEETYNFLLKQGFDKKSIVLSGIALSKDTAFAQIYDRFRGRLMFPISDSMGRIVGFGGRALKADQEPKYLNSPETPIYQKGNVLYGFSISKAFIKDQHKAIIVEGYMDLLAAYQNNLKSVVAVSGTALTQKQLNHLKPYISELILAFDMDNAGQEAAKRSYELASTFNFEVKVFSLPEGKDIAEFAQKHSQDLASLLESAELFTDYFFKKLLGKYNLSVLQDKKRFLQDFAVFFDYLTTNIEKDEYVRKVASELDLSESKIYDELKNLRLNKSHPARDLQNISSEIISELGPKYYPEELIIGLMLEFPIVFEKFKYLVKDDFFSSDLNPIYIAFFEKYNPSGAQFDMAQKQSLELVFEDIDYDIVQKVNLLSLYVHEKYKDSPDDLIEKELNALVFKVINNKLELKKRELHKKILDAEKTDNVEQMQKLLKELNSLHINK